MKIIDFFRKRFSSNFDIFYSCMSEYFYKDMAIQSAINIIAKGLSNSEFITYNKGVAVKSDNYWVFNISPNQNQNKYDFIFKLIEKLVYNNECLVVQENGNFYVADSFYKKKYALYDYQFSQIVVDDLLFTKTYSMRDVFYFKLSDQSIKDCIDGLYESYGKMLGSAMKSYRRNMGIRGKLSIKTVWSQNQSDQKDLESVIKDKFKNYMESDNAILPQEDGFDFTENNNRSGANSDEVNKLIDKIFDMVALAFNIPRGLMKGDLADVKNQTHNFITFCIDPLAGLIETEINKKYYRKNDYLNNTKLKIDTSRIEHVNIFDVASQLDVLTRIGFSHDEQLEMLDKEPLNKPWSKKHYITKNYGDAEDIEKGGE